MSALFEEQTQKFLLKIHIDSNGGIYSVIQNELQQQLILGMYDYIMLEIFKKNFEW